MSITGNLRLFLPSVSDDRKFLRSTYLEYIAQLKYSPLSRGWSYYIEEHSFLSCTGRLQLTNFLDLRPDQSRGTYMLIRDAKSSWILRIFLRTCDPKRSDCLLPKLLSSYCFTWLAINGLKRHKICRNQTEVWQWRFHVCPFFLYSCVLVKITSKTQQIMIWPKNNCPLTFEVLLQADISQLLVTSLDLRSTFVQNCPQLTGQHSSSCCFCLLASMLPKTAHLEGGNYVGLNDHYMLVASPLWPRGELNWVTYCIAQLLFFWLWNQCCAWVPVTLVGVAHEHPHACNIPGVSRQVTQGKYGAPHWCLRYNMMSPAQAPSLSCASNQKTSVVHFLLSIVVISSK